WTRIVLGDKVRGKAHLEECLRLARLADATMVPPVLFLEGTYLVLSHADPRGLELLAAAREGFLAVGATGDAHMVLLILALAAGLLGPSDIADAASDECLEEAERHQAEWAITWAQWTQCLPARTKQP